MEIKMLNYGIEEIKYAYYYSDTPLLDVFALPIVFIITGLIMRHILAGIFEKLFGISIFHNGIPILGPIAFVLFPTTMGLFPNLGFYLIDFVATINLFKPKSKESKNDKRN
jgi:hypothetical protein